MFKEIDFKPGIVTYSEFNIDEKLAFEEQELEYNEDMLQVDFYEKYTIDIGWYPAHDKKGKYTIVLIEDCNWEKPIIKKRTKSLKKLKIYLQEFIDVAKNQKM